MAKPSSKTIHTALSILSTNNRHCHTKNQKHNTQKFKQTQTTFNNIISIYTWILQAVAKNTFHQYFSQHRLEQISCEQLTMGGGSQTTTE